MAMTQAKFACAVDGCDALGQKQVCFACKKYHHHGLVHYDTLPTEMRFREGWERLCDTHHAMLKAEYDNPR